jgi:hypothetical protein
MYPILLIIVPSIVPGIIIDIYNKHKQRDQLQKWDNIIKCAKLAL